MVPTDQLSLAIGKGGQNVRLAAKLTGYKIDLIGSETVSDLDAAMQAAASRLDDTVTDDDSRAAFDALFSTADDPSSKPKPDQAEDTSPDITNDQPDKPSGETTS